MKTTVYYDLDFIVTASSVTCDNTVFISVILGNKHEWLNYRSFKQIFRLVVNGKIIT